MDFDLRPFRQRRVGNDDPVFDDPCNGDGHDLRLCNGAAFIVAGSLAASAGLNRDADENGLFVGRGMGRVHGAFQEIDR
jgi:hypothetical protein